MIRIPLLTLALPLALLSSAAWATLIPVPGGALRVTRILAAEAIVQIGATRFIDDDETFFVLPIDRPAAEALVVRLGLSASALTQAEGNVEVGVGAFRAGSTTATGVFEMSVHNDSPASNQPTFEFDVAAGAILLTDFSSGGFTPPGGPQGAVSITIDYSVGNGPLVPAFRFDAALEVIAGLPSILVTGPVTTTFTQSRGRYELAIHEFQGSIPLPEIPAGESFQIIYQMSASGSLGDSPFFGNEWGYRAAIGDPLDLSAGGGIVVVPSPVPEPAASALFALGLLALGALRRSACLACPPPLPNLSASSKHA